MKLCLYGGSFDPVHNGHLFYARKAQEQLSPDRIILMPANRSPFKEKNPIAGSHRLEMLKRAFTGMENIQISTWELEKPGPSYTIDTVRYLISLYDAVKKLYILAGMDQMVEIEKWKDIEEMLSLGVSFAVFPRKGYSFSDIHPDFRPLCVLIDGPVVEISASDLREKIRKGKDVSGLIPPSVLNYIQENKLYIHA
ncbi:MAG: putative nicotinate-nucleotide adenylyltransferase [Marinimicrobia bacterium 46_43]|nr:MAG: putative nicotinate-nucleotide adenylyltransferase [Marinimicrobia bacterium 46_43]HBY18528.1 nicotinate (nicotinamide) nucleotide adenylyltransferase [Candidatus Neomarinimicrobiota bacterium]